MDRNVKKTFASWISYIHDNDFKGETNSPD